MVPLPDDPRVIALHLHFGDASPGHYGITRDFHPPAAPTAATGAGGPAAQPPPILRGVADGGWARPDHWQHIAEIIIAGSAG